MVHDETMLTLFLFYFFSFFFVLNSVLALISLFFPKIFVRFKLPSHRFKQFIIFIVFSLFSLAISHIFIPKGFP